MKNYHVIKVKYLGATNYKPSRIRLTSERFHDSIILDSDNDYETTYEQAEMYLVWHGHNVVGHAEGKDYMYVISETFEPLKSK